MTGILFRGATIVAMDGVHGSEPFVSDVLVEGATIAAIGPALRAGADVETIDAAGKLLMPGLVNAHAHSSETFFRGRYQGMPLEIWLLYAYPLLMGPAIPKRLLYLRSLLLAMESLHNGVTTLCDDFFDPPHHDITRLATVFDAYEAAGIRANVSSAVMNVHPLDALPYAREIVPERLQKQLAYGEPISTDAYIAYCRRAFSQLHGRAGRLNFMVAPSAPQRCTPDLLQACYELACEKNAPFHIHVLETKTQAVTGHMVFAKSLVAYMSDLGVLGRNTTIAHSVWVSDADIALLGEAGVSVAHNAVSNQKLGAGVAPVRRLLDAGVTMALGTDGISSNDTARLFDVMRVAGLVHSVSGPDYSQWIGADAILRMATIGGARSAMLEGATGSIEPDKAADLLLLDLASYAFTPLGDIAKHLVFAENGSSIEMVVVNGDIVKRHGRLTRIDEADALAEIRATVPAYLAEHAKIEALNRVFEPYMAEIHRRATRQDIGLNRYAGDMEPWTRRNEG